MGELKKIYVQVAGLCMITQYQNQIRVLMPAVNHDGQRHWPFLHVPQEFDGGGCIKRLGASYFERVLDLSDLKTKNGAYRSISGLVIDTAHLTAGTKVQKRFLENHPRGDLQARVHLPLASASFVGLGDSAKLLSKRGSNPGRFEGYGRVGIEIDVDDTVDVLEIPMLNLSITPIQNRVELTLLNIRPKDWGKPNEHVNADKWLEHTDSYFDLLERLDANDRPSIHSPDAHTGVGPRPGDLPPEAIGYKDFEKWPPQRSTSATDKEPAEDKQAKGIDPYACTVGGGCPNGQC